MQDSNDIFNRYGYEASSVDRMRHETWNDNRRRGQELLLQAEACYAAGSEFRRQRDRCKRYHFGDQWSDIVKVNGRTMSEEEYLAEQGCVPLKTNLIRRLVTRVIGVWSGQETEPSCIARDRDEQELGETMSTTLQYNMDLNQMKEIERRTLEEYLISGFAVFKMVHEWRRGKMECWTDYVQPNNFFIDPTMRDFRGHDCQILGEIHDVSFETVCGAFARCPEDYIKLTDIYAAARESETLTMMWEDFGMGRKDYDKAFMTPQSEGLCRVVELWKLEQKPRWRCHDTLKGEVYKVEIEDKAEIDAENTRRIMQARQAGLADNDAKLIRMEWMMDSFWYYYYLTPMGDILQEGETPFNHGEHPYAFKPYPFIDGETHSFVADIIPQQQYTNRLISLYDMIMRSSAKGVLMIPRDMLKGQSLEAFKASWAKPNGVIVYEPSKSGDKPQQMTANSTNIGIDQLLQMELKFFEEISGVNGALQGKPGYAGMSAALYNQQTQNATTGLLDLVDSYNNLLEQAAWKMVKNMQQYYDDRKIINIVGRQAVLYDPAKLRDLEFDVRIVQSQATPVYRAMANDYMMQIYQKGDISLEELLETSSLPFADRMLQKIKSRPQMPQQGEPGVQMPQQIAQAQ